jgi:hypothetical protein
MNNHCSTTGAGAAIASLVLFSALAPTSASADPPYGDDFDAPATFDEAVLIAPEASYSGTTGSVGDVDYYKFDVAEGQDIFFSCFLEGTFVVTPLGFYAQECVETLLDPAGNERDSAPPSFSLHAEHASAGEWRIRIENGVPNNSASPSYIFGVSLQSGSLADTGDGGGGGGGGGGGMVSGFSSLLFAALALLRGSRRYLPVLPALRRRPGDDTRHRIRG